MKHLRGINESNSNRVWVLVVTGGDDFHACDFENTYGGTPVKDVIDNLEQYESDRWELEVYNFGPIDSEFVKFIKDKIQDYDDSKNTNFYMEGDTI
jgi:hypothetical protein